MLDGDRLVCSGSNHVPGCDHFPPEVIEQLEETIRLQDEAAVSHVVELPPRRGLTLTVDVSIARAGRRKCPICGRKRRLVKLSAFSADQPVGYGEARCLECAELRPTAIRA